MSTHYLALLTCDAPEGSTSLVLSDERLDSLMGRNRAMERDLIRPFKSLN